MRGAVYYICNKDIFGTENLKKRGYGNFKYCEIQLEPQQRPKRKA